MKWRIASMALVATCALAAVAACRSSSAPTDAAPDAAPDATTHATTDTSAAGTDAAAVVTATDTCEPLAVEVPELAIRSNHDAPLAPLVDFGTGMDAFFEKLARRARGQPVTLRIGIYGDSNLANDRTPGDIRRRLQSLYGDNGHGWVSFGKPWGWYQHADLEHGITGTWTSYNLSNKRSRDNYYGFAGTSAESTQAGATAWVATAKSTAPIGQRVATFELFYLARPDGGSFEVAIDGAAVEQIDTRAPAPALAVKTYRVADGPHRLVVTVRSGRVRVYGVALERELPGVVIDSLGVGSLHPLLISSMDRAHATAGLQRRAYDLVVETTGSNMCIPHRMPTWLGDVVETWREALPGAGILLWTPPDAVRLGTFDSDPMMRRCTDVRSAIARDRSTALWDLYTTLGGFGSMPKWLAGSRYQSWVQPDGLHLGPTLNKYIGERFVRALLLELARRARGNPRLGC